MREIAELLVHAIFAAKEMALDFDVNVFAAEDVEQELGMFSRTLGSARVSRVGDGVPASRTFARRESVKRNPLRKDCFGETPKPTRETHALPGTGRTLDHSATNCDCAPQTFGNTLGHVSIHHC